MCNDDEVTLVAGEERIVVSRDHLVSVSPYFHAMFNDGFVESERTEVVLKAVDGGVLRDIIRFSEGGSILVDGDNVFAILETAEMFAFDAVKQHCSNYLKAKLNEANALQIFSECGMFGELQVFDIARKLILWNFETCFQSEYLRHVPADMLASLLDDPRAHVRSEMDILKLLLKWLELQTNDRAKMKLLECIRWSHISPEEYRLFSSHPFVKGCENKLEELAKVTKKKRHVPALPAVVGKSEMFIFNPKTCDLDRKPIVPVIFASKHTVGYRVTAVGPHLYVTGGEYTIGRSDWNWKVWKYDGIFNEWFHILDMERVRRAHAVVEHEEKLYLFGGYGRHRLPLDDVDMIDLNTLTVHELARARLPAELHNMAVAVLDGIFYLFTNQIRTFDPCPGSCEGWKELEEVSLPENKDFNSAVTAKGCIYVVGKHSYDLYKFDKSAMTFGVVGQFSSEAQNICLVGDLIYNFSTDQFSGQSTIETYDIVCDTFSFVQEYDFESESGRARSNVDFSSHFSFGCFPLTIY